MTNERAMNHEWIGTASAEQLRDLAFWLNAYEPRALTVAIADIEADAGDEP